MMQGLYIQNNYPIIFYDKSKNFVIETYKKKNDFNFFSRIFNETIMSKNIFLFIIF